MNQSENKPPLIEKAAEELFHYAIDREMLNWLVSRLPEDTSVPRATVEYELQLLHIIGTGWAVSYYMESSPGKQPLLSAFWKSIFEFSGTLSETAGRVTNREIDYFQVLKDRLDDYVKTIAESTDAQEPAVAVGEEFSRICGNPADIFIRMTGSKLFMTTLVRVRNYLENSGLI